MDKQDTFHKLKDNIYTGMKIEHKFRGQESFPEFDWHCTINEIQSKINVLKVTITNNKTGHSHPEDWDMSITVNGLACGEYVESRGNEDEI